MADKDVEVVEKLLLPAPSLRALLRLARILDGLPTISVAGWRERGLCGLEEE